jgi:hypothetical protein
MTYYRAFLHCSLGLFGLKVPMAQSDGHLVSLTLPALISASSGT